MRLSRRTALCAAVVVTAAWYVAITVVNRRAVDELRSHNLAFNQRLVAHGQPPLRIPVSDTLWVREGLLALLFGVLLIGLGSFVEAGGHRRWGLFVVAEFALSPLVAGLNSGWGAIADWGQPHSNLEAWRLVGIGVDALFAVSVVGLLVVGARNRAAFDRSVPAVARSVPGLVLVTGWWVMRHQYSDPDNRVWLARALLFVLVAALISRSALPVTARVLGVVVLLPLCSQTVVWDLLGDFHYVSFPTAYFLRHAAVAAGVGLYAAGVPVVVQRLRARPAPAPA